MNQTQISTGSKLSQGPTDRADLDFLSRRDQSRQVVLPRWNRFEPDAGPAVSAERGPIPGRRLNVPINAVMGSGREAMEEYKRKCQFALH